MMEELKNNVSTHGQGVKGNAHQPCNNNRGEITQKTHTTHSGPVRNQRQRAPAGTMAWVPKDALYSECYPALKCTDKICKLSRADYDFYFQMLRDNRFTFNTNMVPIFNDIKSINGVVRSEPCIGVVEHEVNGRCRVGAEGGIVYCAGHVATMNRTPEETKRFKAINFIISRNRRLFKKYENKYEACEQLGVEESRRMLRGILLRGDLQWYNRDNIDILPDLSVARRFYGVIARLVLNIAPSAVYIDSVLLGTVLAGLTVGSQAAKIVLNHLTRFNSHRKRDVERSLLGIKLCKTLVETRNFFLENGMVMIPVRSIYKFDKFADEVMDVSETPIPSVVLESHSFVAKEVLENDIACNAREDITIPDATRTQIGCFQEDYAVATTAMYEHIDDICAGKNSSLEVEFVVLSELSRGGGGAQKKKKRSQTKVWVKKQTPIVDCGFVFPKYGPGGVIDLGTYFNKESDMCGVACLYNAFTTAYPKIKCDHEQFITLINELAGMFGHELGSLKNIDCKRISLIGSLLYIPVNCWLVTMVDGKHTYTQTQRANYPINKKFKFNPTVNIINANHHWMLADYKISGETLQSDEHRFILNLPTIRGWAAAHDPDVNSGSIVPRIKKLSDSTIAFIHQVYYGVDRAYYYSYLNNDINWAIRLPPSEFLATEDFIFNEMIAQSTLLIESREIGTWGMYSQIAYNEQQRLVLNELDDGSYTLHVNNLVSHPDTEVTEQQVTDWVKGAVPEEKTTATASVVTPTSQDVQSVKQSHVPTVILRNVNDNEVTIDDVIAPLTEIKYDQGELVSVVDLRHFYANLQRQFHDNKSHHARRTRSLILDGVVNANGIPSSIKREAPVNHKPAYSKMINDVGYAALIFHFHRVIWIETVTAMIKATPHMKTRRIALLTSALNISKVPSKFVRFLICDNSTNPVFNFKLSYLSDNASDLPIRIADLNGVIYSDILRDIKCVKSSGQCISSLTSNPAFFYAIKSLGCGEKYAGHLHKKSLHGDSRKLVFAKDEDKLVAYPLKTVKFTVDRSVISERLAKMIYGFENDDMVNDSFAQISLPKALENNVNPVYDTCRNKILSPYVAHKEIAEQERVKEIVWAIDDITDFTPLRNILTCFRPNQKKSTYTTPKKVTTPVTPCKNIHHMNDKDMKDTELHTTTITSVIPSTNPVVHSSLWSKFKRVCAYSSGVLKCISIPLCFVSPCFGAGLCATSLCCDGALVTTQAAHESLIEKQFTTRSEEVLFDMTLIRNMPRWNNYNSLDQTRSISVIPSYVEVNSAFVAYPQIELMKDGKEYSLIEGSKKFALAHFNHRHLESKAFTATNVRAIEDGKKLTHLAGAQ